MTLFDTIMFLISHRKTNNLLNKIEILFNNNKLTEEEYNTLIQYLNNL